MKKKIQKRVSAWSEAKKEVVQNALRIPFQGMATMGQGRDKFVASAGLFTTGKGTVRAGVKLRF